MEKRTNVYFALSFFLIQYAVLFIVLYALRSLVFLNLFSVGVTSFILIIYLVTSFFVLRGLVEAKKKPNTDIARQVNAYRKDSEDTAVKLNEIKRHILEGEHELALEIISSVSSENKKSESVTVYERPRTSFLDTYINKYVEVCKNKRIHFTFEADDVVLGQCFSAKALSSILGNLIDNAIDALGDIDSAEDKWIYLAVKYNRKDRDCKTLDIVVSNGGQTLHDNHKSKIFLEGVTSKQGENHGYGLSVVKDIVKQLGGTVQVYTLPETTFHVTVPK